MRRHPSARRVKIHYTYTVIELAKAIGRTPATVRAWIKDGLEPIDRSRPVLLMGSEVHRFLDVKRGKSRKQCGPGEMYCVACRDVRTPAYGEAEYHPFTSSGGNLRALCSACGNLMHRRVALAKLDAVLGDVSVSSQQRPPRLNGTSEPSHNPHFDKDC